jgi:hypothetical protein
MANAAVKGPEVGSVVDTRRPAPNWDPIEGFAERIRNKAYSLSLFTDHAKYRTMSPQSIARDISSLLEEEVSALGVLV